MSVAACLIVYSLTVLALGPRLLERLTRDGHAPRLGVAAWLTAIVSVLLTWVAVSVLVILEVAQHWNYPGALFATCLAWLGDHVTGHAGIAPHILLLALAAAAGLLAAVTTARMTRVAIRMRARAHTHAQAVRLVGRPTAASDVVVIEADAPATYCVSGRPSAIVVTSAALAALDSRELAAVLAHERAHLAGHHALVVTALRSLAAVLPNLTLITQGTVQVSRLLEMCADDAAANRHGRGPLLSGLITLCGRAPAEALGAADIAVLARAERLSAPWAQEATVRARTVLTSTVTLLAVGPLMIVALAATGLIMCGA